MSASGEPTSAAARLSRDTADLATEQLRDLLRSLAEPLRATGEGTALLVGAGVAGGLALATAHLAVLRTAEAILPRPLAAMAVAAAYGGGAVVLGLAARESLHRAAEQSDTALQEATEGNGARGGESGGGGGSGHSGGSRGGSGAGSSDESGTGSAVGE